MEEVEGKQGLYLLPIVSYGKGSSFVLADIPGNEEDIHLGKQESLKGWYADIMPDK